MTRKILPGLLCIQLLVLSACTSFPLDRLTVGTSMITTGGNLGKWQEIPMSAVQTKDTIYMVTYVRWEPVEQDAGRHDVSWIWYHNGRIAFTCNSIGLIFNKSPARLWCRTQAAGLGVGHFRVELSIDGVPFAKNEFDIIDVLGDEHGAHATYDVGSMRESKDGGETPAASKGELLSHCPNAIQVAREVGFPFEAAENGLRAGSVTLSMILTPAGSVKSIQVVASTDRSFNQAAIDATTRLRCSGDGLTHDTEIRWEVAYKVK